MAPKEHENLRGLIDARYKGPSIVETFLSHIGDTCKDSIQCSLIENKLG